MLTKALSFNDIRIVPAPMSRVKSRNDVNTKSKFTNWELGLPVLASNMDSVYSLELARQVYENGGVAVMHRFMSIEDGVKEANAAHLLDIELWASVGVGEVELARAKALSEAGISTFVVDVANAGALHVVKQFDELVKLLPPYTNFIVGNFATKEQINAFCKGTKNWRRINAVKVSVGSGSACETAVVTGVGLPSVATIQSCKNNKYNIPIIFDGGIKDSGDFCKALALGASAVMMGRLFAQCEGSGGEKAMIDGQRMVRYRGSASLESYKIQGKESPFRSSEGQGGWLQVNNTVKDLMEQFSGGLRSSMSYCNAFTIKEFQTNASFVEVTNNGKMEGEAHGFRK